VAEDTPSTEAPYVYDEANEARCTLPNCHCRYSGRPPRHPVRSDTPSTEALTPEQWLIAEADPASLLALADEWCERTEPTDIARLNVRSFAVWADLRRRRQEAADPPDVEVITDDGRPIAAAAYSMEGVETLLGVRQEAADTSVLDSAYRMALAQIEHDGEVIKRLTQALRVASHKPHDQDGEPNEGFPTCSVCGAIQTGEAADTSGLREALLMFGHEYDVDGRMEWHSYNCTYRKTWPMFDGDTSMDERQCIAARAALEGATE
jgi:hypothetical protein